MAGTDKRPVTLSDATVNIGENLFGNPRISLVLVILMRLMDLPV